MKFENQEKKCGNLKSLFRRKLIIRQNDLIKKKIVFDLLESNGIHAKHMNKYRGS